MYVRGDLYYCKYAYFKETYGQKTEYTYVMGVCIGIEYFLVFI